MGQIGARIDFYAVVCVSVGMFQPGSSCVCSNISKIAADTSLKISEIQTTIFAVFSKEEQKVLACFS